MKLRPYKFIVAPIVQELNDEGEVIGERDGRQNPTVIYGTQALAEWAASFAENLEEAVKKETSNG